MGESSLKAIIQRKKEGTSESLCVPLDEHCPCILRFTWFNALLYRFVMHGIFSAFIAVGFKIFMDFS
ncbi:hypothetical protein [Bartonella vinsonii]|uniref:hypothetical protein n=1 Tax=Bartonella vinsonii TaxID=33047 RepID=UPI00034B1265|nr:hypothetical protein [Bartonella vinsonii]